MLESGWCVCLCVEQHRVMLFRGWHGDRLAWRYRKETGTLPTAIHLNLHDIIAAPSNHTHHPSPIHAHKGPFTITVPWPFSLTGDSRRSFLTRIHTAALNFHKANTTKKKKKK